MVDHHPSESIVNLGSASVDNVFSGWQSTMLPYKECDIYPPLEKGGAYCFAHVGRSVCRYPLTLCN